MYARVKPLVLELPENKRVELSYNPWDKEYVGHISYDFDIAKMTHEDFGVNQIGNCVANQFKSPQFSYGLEFTNSILTITVRKNF